IPKWRPTVSRIFGANWRRQARDRLPLYQLRALRLGLHRCLDVLDHGLKLLVRQLFERVPVLDLVLARHQQSEDLEIGRRLGAAPPRNGLFPVLGEISQQRANHRLAQLVTRATQSSGGVSLNSQNGKSPLPGGQARRSKLLVSWGPLVITAPLAGSLIAPLRCAAPCQFRCRVISPPSRYPHLSQADFAPSARSRR